MASPAPIRALVNSEGGPKNEYINNRTGYRSRIRSYMDSKIRLGSVRGIIFGLIVDIKLIFANI